MTMGIYCLHFKGTTKVYIGKSKDIEGRYVVHKTTMRHNRTSKKLREAYQLYGIPELEILLECSLEELCETEKEAIQIYDSINNGFNTTLGGEDGTWEGLAGTSNPKSVYSEEQLKAVLILLQDTLNTNKIISEITGVSTHVIINISCGRGHRWLEQDMPEEYSRVMSLKGNRYSSKAIGIKFPPVVSPEGTIYRDIEDVQAFSKLHGLTSTHLARVLKGKVSQHKGWKLFREEK